MRSQRSFRTSSLVDSVRAQLARREARRGATTGGRRSPAGPTPVERAALERAAAARPPAAR